MHRSVTIVVDETTSVSVPLSLPVHRRSAPAAGVILAHGAANDMHNPLLSAMAEGLAEAGYPALRFNFPYADMGKKRPDGQRVLEATWKRAVAFFRTTCDPVPRQVIGAGKSMGGRVLSQLTATGDLPVDGLIFYGYPLHAPGRKDTLRDAHLYDIQLPMRFFAGTRDTLCDLEKLQGVLARLGPRADLEIVKGADHSFRVPAAAGISQQAVYRNMRRSSLAWLADRDV